MAARSPESWSTPGLDPDGITAVLGIGINVNVESADLPPGATSLSAAVGKIVPRDDLLQVVLTRLNTAYSAFTSAAGRPNLDGWTRRAALIGERVQVSDGPAQHSGRCLASTATAPFFSGRRRRDRQRSLPATSPGDHAPKLQTAESAIGPLHFPTDWRLPPFSAIASALCRLLKRAYTQPVQVPITPVRGPNRCSDARPPTSAKGSTSR